ncbi:MAG: nitroreductase family protein [Myxococcota bacterium]
MIDLQNADELLTTTRGVRKRIDFDREVPLSLIEACVDVALQAPCGTGASTNAGVGSAVPHFVVVTSPEKKKAVGDVYRAAHHPYIDHHAAQDPAREAAGGFDLARWQTDHFEDYPVLVLVCGNAPVDQLSPGMQVGMWGSILPGAWSFMLAARARGLGSCWTTIHLDGHTAPMAEALGLPDHVSQGVLIPVGFYTGKTFKRATRPAAKDVMHLDGW